MYCYWLVMRKRRDFVYILDCHLVWLTLPTTQKWLVTWNFRGFSSNTHISFMNFFSLKRLAGADLIKHFQINLKNCAGAPPPCVHPCAWSDWVAVVVYHNSIYFLSNEIGMKNGLLYWCCLQVTHFCGVLGFGAFCFLLGASEYNPLFDRIS